jgi:hypothetical protein
MFLFIAPLQRFIPRFDRFPAPRLFRPLFFWPFKFEIELPHEHTRHPKTFRKCKAIMKQPYEQVWTNHDQQSKPTTGEQQPDVCGCHGEHLEGCPNAGRPFKPTTGQEWTAEKLYEAVCLKGYYDLAQELNASIAVERKAADKIAENARQLHIYNQQLRSQLIVQQKLRHLLSAARSS